MTIALVQHSKSAIASGISTFSTSLSGCTVGNWLIACYWCDTTGATPPTVSSYTDVTGGLGSYSVAVDPGPYYDGNSFAIYGGIYYLKITSGTSHSFDLVLSGNINGSVALAEFSGIASASPLDAANYTQQLFGTTLPMQSQNITLSQNGELIVCSLTVIDSGGTDLSPWTVTDTNSSNAYSGIEINNPAVYNPCGRFDYFLPASQTTTKASSSWTQNSGYEDSRILVAAFLPAGSVITGVPIAWIRA